MTSKLWLFISQGQEDAKASSHALLSRAVKAYFAAVGEAQEPVLRSSEGKPYFPSGKHFLSVTHTHGLYLAAFAPFPMGLDAEREDTVRSRVRSRYFTEEEKALPFAYVWTAREAVGKLAGKGLSDALSAEVKGETVCLHGKDYELRTVPVAGYVVTLCTEEGETFGIQTLSEK